MARVHFVKKARKDNPAVKAGESYWWWKFRHGPKRYSATYPERSELTQSAFYSAVYDLQDNWQGNPVTLDNAHEIVDNVIERVEELRDSCQESLDNMPDSLQDGPTGELLQERIDSLDNVIGELEDVRDEAGFDPEYDDAEEFDPDAVVDGINDALGCIEG